MLVLVARFRSPTWFGLLLAAVIVTTVGCGDGRPSRVPVSGQVLIDGQPLTHGYVRLVHPTSRPSTGKIDSEGRFTLSCFGQGDGAIPGIHQVAIDAKKPLGDDRIEWHAPKKYAKAATSGIEVEITKATDDLTINISWDGKKGPIVERF